MQCSSTERTLSRYSSTLTLLPAPHESDTAVVYVSVVHSLASSQVDTSTRNPESVKQGYLFEVPVQKWSRTERAFKNRLLALTKSSVVEMDVATRSVPATLASHQGLSLSWCFCAVLLILVLARI